MRTVLASGVATMAAVWLTAGAAFAASTAAPAQRVSFRESARLAIGHAPRALAVGDLDHDGRPDVVLVNDDSTVTTLLGDGAGGLRAQRDRVVAPDLVGVALGDVNFDGRLDAAVSASTSGAVFFLLGAGDGSFAPGDTLRGPWAPGALSLQDLRDPNLPNVPILIVADLFFQGIVEVETGGLSVVGQFAGFIDPVDIAVGNMFGNATLAVADQTSHNATVLIGNGFYGPERRRDSAVAGRPVAVAFGDVDGDGRDELIVATRDPGTLAVLRGTADGSLLPAHTYAAGADIRALAVADFDRDGRLDVVSADHASDSIGFWLGIGDAALATSVPLPTGAGPVALAVADMNGDGWPDIVSANESDGTVQVMLNQTGPAPGSIHLRAPAPNPASAASTVSFVLPAAAEVRIEIQDVTGRVVRGLLHATLPPGTHEVTWDGRTDAGDLARSGLYFARVRAGSAEATTRIVLER